MRLTARARTLTAPAALLCAALLATATGCSDAEPELEVGEATTVVNEGVVTPSPTDDGSSVTVSVVDDPTLNPAATTVGAVTLHLPLGWDVIPGADTAAPSEASAVTGGATVTSMPAQGRSAEDWSQSLINGAMRYLVIGEGLEPQAPIETATGQEVFHLTQPSENRSHLFGMVVDDTLHLVTFGLDGSAEAAATVLRSASTIRPAD